MKWEIVNMAQNNSPHRNTTARRITIHCSAYDSAVQKEYLNGKGGCSVLGSAPFVPEGH